MAEASIPVDLRNPGQVFACLGLMEAAEILCGPAVGGYRWEEDATSAKFTLSVAGLADPLITAITFLSTAKAYALDTKRRKRKGTDEEKKWRIVIEPFDRMQTDIFPISPPKELASLPLRLSNGTSSILVSYWGDDPRFTLRDNAKFWGGSQGKPGVAFAEDALELLRGSSGVALDDLYTDPFAFSGPLSGSFRLDWRRDYVPLDAGFSMNNHKATMAMVGFPLVELLAAIGLENARPNRQGTLAYGYAVSNADLPTIFARAVLGGESCGFNIRRFQMQLGWPGQEGQARCIIDSREE